MATKWTLQQEEIILQEVEKNPENLRDSFFIASLKINRTASSVCTHYYSKMINGKQNKEEQIKKMSEELISLYETNLELKKELEKWKKF
jgi:hypothetical protein